ncbi:bifunctional alpha/beta hydrolase/OsmC family protein [Altibacter sp.]|uniref:bifunctional alpha/beta hydrolase/OsmC family protein n=1 Tax=Altibacter sp. TaxID=2024823 RepID=UPI00258B7912|nr:bifunctional alpha/beta hydrolase/OsmC family protein [Altibacter sp.]MCW8981325.1 bifunctional alpha/beta hydrolase/OsmC family protein [Altibacter sp.]MCW9038003.1 bifunctional alpha/beta hydrolase/OsmC family protein [Altibacter sp.]
MNFEKVSFKNAEGQTLSGRLELPVDRHPHNFAVFAHCFTCTKNLLAVKNISRALTASGIGVLRFDFTGLGESEGAFADTNFSGNVEDLIAASAYLSQHHKAPSLLVGHSLGGAAIIYAAMQLPSVEALATIGAPSNPLHVQHLIKSELAEIQQKGVAQVNLGGREFKIKKQFLDDLETKSLQKVLKDLRKAILILHSPQDTTVGIRNAEELYLAAHHPKSFVSLDGADHLLSLKQDSLYVGKVIAGWASRYLSIPEVTKVRTQHDVVASLEAANGFTTQMKLGSHYMVADEPTRVGGNDFGPTPYELVSAGLSACTAMTIQMYARRKNWDVQHVEVHTSYDKDYAQDCENCELDTAKIDTFTREIRLEGDLDEKQIKRLLEIADKCPVHKTLHTATQVITKLIA